MADRSANRAVHLKRLEEICELQVRAFVSLWTMRHFTETTVAPLSSNHHMRWPAAVDEWETGEMNVSQRRDLVRLRNSRRAVIVGLLSVSLVAA